MRGVAGILFLSVGFMVAYLVLSGKLPSSGNLVSAPAGAHAPLAQSGSSTLKQTQNKLLSLNNASGGGPGPMGLPTMGYFHDLVASRGGLA